MLKLCKFADDTRLGGRVVNYMDVERLREDLDSGHWIDRCALILISAL